MQKENDNDKSDLRAYRIGPLTLLELMTVLAVLGLLLTWIWQKF